MYINIHEAFFVVVVVSCILYEFFSRLEFPVLLFFRIENGNSCVRALIIKWHIDAYARTFYLILFILLLLLFTCFIQRKTEQPNFDSIHNIWHVSIRVFNILCNQWSPFALSFFLLFFHNFWIHENKTAERKNHDKMCWTHWESASKAAVLNQLYMIQLSVCVCVCARTQKAIISTKMKSMLSVLWIRTKYRTKTGQTFSESANVCTVHAVVFFSSFLSLYPKCKSSLCVFTHEFVIFFCHPALSFSL